MHIHPLESIFLSVPSAFFPCFRCRVVFSVCVLQEIDLDVKVYRKAMRSTTILVSALVPWAMAGSGEMDGDGWFDGSMLQWPPVSYGDGWRWFFWNVDTQQKARKSDGEMEKC